MVKHFRSYSFIYDSNQSLVNRFMLNDDALWSTQYMEQLSIEDYISGNALAHAGKSIRHVFMTGELWQFNYANIVCYVILRVSCFACILNTRVTYCVLFDSIKYTSTFHPIISLTQSELQSLDRGCNVASVLSDLSKPFNVLIMNSSITVLEVRQMIGFDHNCLSEGK